MPHRPEHTVGGHAAALPGVLGHEESGIVKVAGEGAGDVRAGSRVILG
ncbi:alcohol dehydrogenase catalytic domain-containing protein [Corynebacterium sp. YIM 101645]|uniref:Alcohol dehydrogenase catalytic domain-containing protein n=1 Tax=Corynebacterium lemuris TaxID=1859292 RepID=A0ABT2FUE6_9CORY|nr:alcohol dehydrogenase catalytic domain-containing protein [Corynebacterium lemuris]